MIWSGTLVMWILLVPLIMAEVVFWGALCYLTWRAFKALRGGNWPLAAVFLGLICIPFVYYFYKHVQADRREAERAAEIAALVRAAPPRSFPKLLEVHGHATEAERLIYLDALGFHEVVIFQRPRRGKIYGQFVTLAAGCQGIGVAYLQNWRKRRRFGAPTQRDKDCLVSKWKTVSADRAAIAALEFRHGRQATLVPSGTNWYSGAYELRLRTPDGTQLIAYWERPYITRPAEPGPWGYAFPSNTDWKKYRKPPRLDFFLKALGRSH